jgi:hypothetical protein
LTALEIARAKAAADAKKAAADKLALERANLSLKLAGSTLDMQNIEIQAALQRGQTAEVNNVLLLQRAILNDNADQANILAREVLAANGLVMDVNGNISSLAKAKDPFADWPAASKAAMEQLLKIQAELAKIQSKTITVTVNTVYTSSGTTVSTSTGGNGGYTSTGDNGGAGSTNNDQTPGTTVYNATPQYPDYGMQTTPQPTLPSSVANQAPNDTGFANFGLQQNAAAIAKAAIDAVALSSSVAQTSFTQGVAGGNTLAESLAGARYAAQAAAYAKSHGVTITVVAAPNVIVDTTQDASTNGTAVTVNRADPLGMYSS